MDTKTAALIDYARPLINIENYTREIHDLCTDKKFEQAIDKAWLLGVEVTVLRHVMTLMREDAHR